MDPKKILCNIRTTYYILMYCDSCEYSSNRNSSLDIYKKFINKKKNLYIKWKRGHVYK